eukprot:scaffold63716_cov63-Phaeocystis_antarctica.AAC.2
MRRCSAANAGPMRDRSTAVSRSRPPARAGRRRRLRSRASDRDASPPVRTRPPRPRSIARVPETSRAYSWPEHWCRPRVKGASQRPPWRTSACGSALAAVGARRCRAGRIAR